MKKIYLLIIAAMALVLGACNDSDVVLKDKAPIIDMPQGANQGEILVKFKAEASAKLQQSRTRAAGNVMTRSGLSAMDAVLQNIGAYKLERVFPVNERTETRTFDAGLDLWYVIHFEKEVNLEEAAKALAEVPEIAKVQFSHNLQRTYNPQIKPIVLSKQSLNALSATRAGETAVFNDPGLPLQWGYINDGSVLKSEETNEFNETVIPAVAGVDVNCIEAWKLCKGDPSIIVAVLDEGVMWNHPDLRANMWENEAETFASDKDADGNGYAGDRYGFNFVGNHGFISYNDANDTGHGSHVAGTIAAVNGNGIGVCGIAGGDGTPNSGVKIMSCQVFSGNTGVTLYREAQAIKYAADNGAVILQCSWGYNSGLANSMIYSPGYKTDDSWVDGCPLEKEALDYFIHNAGSPNGVIDGGIVIFAGGNESAPMAGYPGAYPDYISVAAIGPNGTPSYFTNYGTGINICAPGGDSDGHKSDKAKIYSTVPPLVGANTYYGYMEGTSQACPHVSGVVALGLSYAAKLHRHFRAEDFRRLIMEATTPIEPYFKDIKVYWPYYTSQGPTSNPMQMEPANFSGKMGGLIDAAALLNKVSGNGVEMTVPNMSVTVNGTSKVNYARYFKGGENMTFTCTVIDNTVAIMTSTDQINFVLKGLKMGSTKAMVTASDGTKKDFYITVRKTNGWM